MLCPNKQIIRPIIDQLDHPNLFSLKLNRLAANSVIHHCSSPYGLVPYSFTKLSWSVPDHSDLLPWNFGISWGNAVGTGFGEDVFDYFLFLFFFLLKINNFKLFSKPESPSRWSVQLYQLLLVPSSSLFEMKTCRISFTFKENCFCSLVGIVSPGWWLLLQYNKLNRGFELHVLHLSWLLLNPVKIYFL